MHLLLIATPRPQMFFTWIIGLATVIAVVYPFSTTAPLSQKVAAAVINLVLGAAIGSLINGTAAQVIRRRAITGGYQPGYPSPAPGTELPRWDPWPHATSAPAAVRLIAGRRERGRRGRTLAGRARRATVRTMRVRRGPTR